MSSPKSVAFYTLGCKLNFSESSALAQQFQEAGFSIFDFAQGADIVIVNTCSVTEFADRKCRQIVRRALRKNPDAHIIVVGCYAQLKPEEISTIPGVDLVLGAKEKFNILQYVEEISLNPNKGLIHASDIEEVHAFTPSFSFGDRTRSFLKVQDGCDYNCSFCTIPLARGKSRSSKVVDVVKQAYEIANLGTKEIVLTGVNIGDFGKSEDGHNTLEKETFYDLIVALEKVDKIERFRISSIEPNLCSDEIIRFVSESTKFLPHFHMPLQSGNNVQLAKMRRRYKRELYQERVECIRSLMPHAAIGVDVIVGFPGETDEHFDESYRFINQLDITYLHVFTYSERNNTIADEMDGVVPMHVRKKRNKMLRILSEKKKRAFYQEFMGSERQVLFEEYNDSSFMSGYTDNYLRVLLPRDESKINRIADVKLTSISSDLIAHAELLV